MTKKSDFNWEGYEQTTRVKSVGIWVGVIIILGFIGIFFFQREAPVAIPAPVIEENDNSKVFTTVTGPFRDKNAMVEFALVYKKEAYSVEIIDQEFVQIGKYRYKNFAVDFSNKLKAQGYFCSVSEWKQGINIDEFENKYLKSDVKNETVQNKTDKNQETADSKKPEEISQLKENSAVKNVQIPLNPVVSKPEEVVKPVKAIETKTTVVKVPVSKTENTEKPVMQDTVRTVKPDQAAVAVPAVVKQTAAVKTPVQAEKYWTIQLGAFGTEENAELLRVTLVEKGFVPQTYVAATQPRYRVQCGRYKTKEACEQSELLKQLVEKGFLAYVRER